MTPNQKSFGKSGSVRTRNKKADVPYRLHNFLDVGVFVVPSHDEDGKPFAYEGENPIQAIDPRLGVTAATRVGWAGFPGIIESALGFPQLCYLEGVVSATVDHDDKQVYIVDGHGSPGVSGGPVWHWSEERNRLEVVGIVCQYQGFGNGLPGFCVFEPINPVVYFVNSWLNAEKRTT